MRRAALATALLLAGCGRGGDPVPAARDAGARLEAAAVAAGLVVDPAARSITGAWALDTDRACIVPAVAGESGTAEGASRIGLLVDYGEGQGCAASGTVRRVPGSGEALDVRLDTGGEGCRVTARFDGRRIVFPPEVPAACDRRCTGRGTLAALTLERQSESMAEAANLRTPSGRALCGG